MARWNSFATLPSWMLDRWSADVSYRQDLHGVLRKRGAYPGSSIGTAPEMSFVPGGVFRHLQINLLGTPFVGQNSGRWPRQTRTIMPRLASGRSAHITTGTLLFPGVP